MEVDGYRTRDFIKAISRLDDQADIAVDDIATGLRTVETLPFKFVSKDKSELSLQQRNLKKDRSVFHKLWQPLKSGKTDKTGGIDQAYENYCMSLARAQSLNQGWQALLDIKNYKKANDWLRFFVVWRKNIRKKGDMLKKDLTELRKYLKKVKSAEKWSTAIQGALDAAIIVTNTMLPPSRILTGVARQGIASAVSLSVDALLGPDAPDLLMDGGATVAGISSEVKALGKQSKALGGVAKVLTAVDTLTEGFGKSDHAAQIEKMIKKITGQIIALEKFHWASERTARRFEAQIRKNLKAMKASYKKAEDSEKLYRALLGDLIK